VEPLIPTELETERLLLRRPVESDAAALVPVFDAEVVRYLDGHVPSEDDLWRSIATFLGHWEMRGFGMHIWVDKATGAVIGRGGLWYPAGWPQLEVGWALGRAHWGRGFATEAGRASLQLAWRHLEPEWVCSVIHPDNARSQAVARALGALRPPEQQVLRGQPVEVWRYDRPPA
jgi:RimJ/RimL family protein N-acetyltransferase